MFEMIGMVATWLVGLFACVAIPTWRGCVVSDRVGRDWGDALAGFWIGCLLAAVYIVATIVYLYNT